MSHYEERLSADTDRLMAKISDLAGRVDAGLRSAVRALEQEDRDLAYDTILRDGPINRLTEAVEAESHRFMAKHLPSGAHLRFVSSAMRIAILLERMGDYAVTICRHAATLNVPLKGTFKREVSAMAADALQMFSQSLEAFLARDASMAKATMGYAEQVDRDYVNALAILREETSEAIPVEDLFARLVIIRQLERVSDQAKNLCEETVFALTGETKHRKPVPVLVLDKNDDGATHLVAAVAERLHQGKVSVVTAGSNPSATVRQEVSDFLLEHGLAAAGRKPKGLNDLEEPVGAYKVIIALEGRPEDYVGRIPYTSVGLSWEAESGADLEATYRQLAGELGDLVALLRG